MAAEVIDGKAVAAQVRGRVAADVISVSDGMGRPPGLATVLVGEDPASAIYVRRKREACEEVGISSFHHEPPGDISQADLLELVEELNGNDEIDGILVQLPLPDGLDAGEVVNALSPSKDVDGLTPTSAGLLARGDPSGLVPCTPSGVMELLRSAGQVGAQRLVPALVELVGIAIQVDADDFLHGYFPSCVMVALRCFQ